MFMKHVNVLVQSCQTCCLQALVAHANFIVSYLISMHILKIEVELIIFVSVYQPAICLNIFW